MRVLIVSQYFWPEYFRINDLAVYLKKKNCNVDILTSYPNYPGGKIYKDFKLNKKKYSNYQNMDIYRVPLIPRRGGSNFFLTLNYISFLFFGFLFSPFILKKKKYDLIFTYGTSPILVGLISIFLAKIKNAKHFLWVLDLWPNVLIDLNILNKKNLIYFFLKNIVIFIYKKTDCIFCQSISFKKEIANLVPAVKSKLVFFPSWSEDAKNSNICANKNNIFEKSYINIVFAGNLGESQNFDYLLNEIIPKINGNIRWHIFGDGRENTKIKKIIKDNKITNVIIHGHKEYNDLTPFLYAADFLLISLRYEKTFSSTIPGKFQTYLQFKKPILAFLGGEVANIIKKYKIGLVYEKNNKPDYQDLKFFLEKKIPIDKQIKILEKIYSKERTINKIFFYYKNFQKIFGHRIKILTDKSTINYKKNFILSALNLSFLGFYVSGEVKLHSNQIFWLDGFFGKFIIKSNTIKKTPGRELIKNITIDKSIIKNVYIIGSASDRVKNHCKNIFNGIKYKHIDLPFSNNIADFNKLIPNFGHSDLVILTLPTPKQEQLAEYIKSISKYYKIICIGGALNMLAGEEKVVPKFLENIFFGEALWRLQYSPTRRTIRIAKTYYYFIKGLANGSFKKIDYEVI